MLSKLRAHPTLLLLIFGLAVVNIMLARLAGHDGVDLTGRVIEHNSPEMMWATVKTLLIFVPLFGFLLGTIISLFPYQQQSYSAKYLRSSLISALVLQVGFFIAGVASLFSLF